jgi:cobalt-zinc-cadmium resistance protein CzcA
LPDTLLLRALAMQPDPSTGAANTDPVLATAAQQAELAKAAWKMERSHWAPTLQGGGFYQTIDDVSPFGGFLLGASIPLPGGGQGARTKAARLRSDIATQQLEELRRSRATELARTRAQWEQLHQGLAYYESTGAALAEALRHDARRAYLNGEAGYVEYLQGMEQARTIEEERLGVRYQTALTLIHLNALMGQ